MEKLQAAIEKAREQRQKIKQPQHVVEQERAQGKTTDQAAGELWESLAEVTVSPHIIARNRLVASSQGAAAVPFDMLRTRILQQCRLNSWKRIALVSPHSACGKSTIAANLAFSFERQSDLRTMVLDLDLRHGGLRKILDQNCTHTMGDVLQGTIPFSKHGQRLGKNLALGFNSKTVRNAAEILQSGKTSEVLEALEDNFKPDIMLLDMPPLMEVDDNFGFLGNADCAILLVEADRTTIEQADFAERQLAELTNVMGVVLNKTHYAEGAYGYGYGHS